MIKPAIDYGSRIQTAPTGKSRVGAKQPKAVAPKLPTVKPGGIPSKDQRATAAKLEMRWCAGHSKFLSFADFDSHALQRGGACIDCRRAADNARKAERKAMTKERGAQIEAARSVYAQKLETDKAKRALALERATGERLSDIATSELLRRAIANSHNPPDIQAEMWENVLYNLHERFTPTEAEARYRARLIETIQA